MQTIRIGVDGMTCASCVGRVERALAAVPGVASAEVNLATESARVAYDGADGGEALGAALREAGYPARIETLVFDVEGMTCASCVGRVERALQGAPGVQSAAVNLAAETAIVTYLEGANDAASLAALMARAGYPARACMPDTPRPENRKDAEAGAMRARFFWAAALTLPVFVLEMGGHLYPPLHHWVMGTFGRAWPLIQFVLISAVLAGPGRVFFAKGLPGLVRGAPDMNALVALGAGASWAYSTLVVFAPTLLPEAARNVYFEAAGVIVTLILLGRWLEARAKGRAGAAIRALGALAPPRALVLRDGAAREVPLDEVALGDHLQVLPGARVPVDGRILTGESHVDEAMMTGEPIPVAKSPGDALTGGTVNGTGTLLMEATAVGAGTTLARIIQMVEEAQGAKLPIQSLVDRVTMVFVPAVMALAGVTVLVWLMFGPEPALSHALVAGVSVLIIACPCAMGLATPTSIMVGTGRAAELGALMRKGEAMQALSGVRTMAFDKTGTLTEGRPELTDFEAVDMGRDAALAMVAAAEAQSEHPIAHAIARASEGLTLPRVDKARAVAGHGLAAVVEGKALLIGAARLMAREGIDISSLAPRAEAWAGAGKTPVYAALDGAPLAVFAVADRIKPSARATVDALHARGLRVAMLTGDATATARAIGAELGIDEIHAELTPKAKVKAIRAMQAAGPVAFVGDGINDAPALANAEVGIAIGTGTDVAIESADVVLMKGDPAGALNAVEISQRTMANIRQNLFWAFGYNAALIPVAAGVLYPLNGMLLSPMLGAGAMALSSVFVLTNALRLRRIKPVLEGTR